ncbi:Glycoside hydrolase, catalytic domain-containing protein [Artemisia annua]|uniref:glucan endo-1,3-beta-D-glucosidase n=1 Tax=Artemisia annua TaxID=35608 RepID=A0A2U1KEQ4_ARTAN|nr:Glycoside hydrolase, catalytic domain-containing protein [Artemisia annua]
MSQTHKIGFIWFIPLLCFLVSTSNAEIAAKPGVNYGQLGNNLPHPETSVELIKTLKAGRVKLYDANPKILKALNKTDIQVSVMVPNEIIIEIAKNQTLADEWISTNVVPFYPHTKIRYVLVGNEILSQPDNVTWFNLVPAMIRIRKSLVSFRLRKVKVSTPLAMDCLETSFPPSNGTFRSGVTESVIRPLLEFINGTKSFFFIDVYTYFAWVANPAEIKLDYALLEPGKTRYTDPVTKLVYTNLLEQMLDALFFAMRRVGYPNSRIFIAETGWPNGCDVDQIGGNIYNAATYNRNVVKWLTRKPARGTPLKPTVVFPSFIFALYNENQKTGPGTERHFGLLYPNGTSIYEIDLSGKTEEYKKALPAPTNNEPYKGPIWCMAARGVNVTALAGALSYACGQGNGTCDPIQSGGKCFRPNVLRWHASYAFSSYWAQFKKAGGSCYFNGLAVQTTENPSFGSCKFPSVTL